MNDLLSEIDATPATASGWRQDAATLYRLAGLAPEQLDKLYQAGPAAVRNAPAPPPVNGSW